MDIFEALTTRRSIRKYNNQPIDNDTMELLLKCAMLAPSARNEQPWHFVVVRDGQKRAELARTTPYTGMAAGAPVVVMVCADTNNDKSEGFWPQDCAAAIENLMLAARGKGIGSVWCGIHPVQERVKTVQATLGLPEKIVPLGMVCLGYSDQKFFEADRFKKDRIHHDQW